MEHGGSWTLTYRTVEPDGSAIALPTTAREGERPMTYSKYGIVLIGLGVASLCPAQHSDPWDRLQTIQPSAKVEVRNLAGKRVSGSFEQATANSIRVRTGQGIVNTTKADVASVSLVMGRSRGKKALIGFAVGAAVMGGLFAIGCARDCDSEEVPYAALAIPFVGGITAGVAALFPQHRLVLYEASHFRGSAK